MRANARAPGEPIPDLVERADQALRKAKRAGRDRVIAAIKELDYQPTATARSLKLVRLSGSLTRTVAVPSGPTLIAGL